MKILIKQNFKRHSVIVIQQHTSPTATVTATMNLDYLCKLNEVVI